ncbi:GNAT family N-acetyltransferase [Chitinispirillales bacterium ANBcel5]|uniref:GNAT family N-acetyltransferase n=1 Tax=Cellulosispirillum alkaliphilum TaxID=3039283 RepID=UPI002A4F2D9E|nr:GNAT family N-acetyltransferase [Chitinispirillales bacterium ANBcel5]
MNSIIEIIYTNKNYVESYNKAIDCVARERKYLATVNGFPMEGSEWFITHMIKNKFPQYFLLSNQEVIGWCDITPKDIPEFSHVGTLGMGIIKNYRGKGYGKKLLLKTIEHAKNINHLEKIELTVFESNEIAIRLYQSLGFEIEGKRIKSRKIDNEYDNEIEMGIFLV